MTDHFIGQGCSKSFKVELANEKEIQYTKIEFSVFEDNNECVVCIANNREDHDEYVISFDDLVEINKGLSKFIKGLNR